MADASHEIKTPITVILANIGRVLSHPDERVGEHRKWLENTRDEAEELRGLVEDMLYLARTDADRDPVRLEDVHLSDILQNCLLSFEPVAFERKVTLNADVAPDTHIRGDAVLLRRLCTIFSGQCSQVCGCGRSGARNPESDPRVRCC